MLRAVSTVEDEESMSVVGELWREGEGCLGEKPHTTQAQASLWNATLSTFVLLDQRESSAHADEGKLWKAAGLPCRESGDYL